MKTGRRVLASGIARATPQGVALFETVGNIHKSEPNASIAFNSRPRRRCSVPTQKPLIEVTRDL
jgi:hypothetical protein